MRRCLLLVALMLIAAPMALAAQVGAGAPRHVIMVLPFELLGDEAKYAWIGQAIAQNLQTELARDPAVRVVGTTSITPAEQPPAGPLALDERAARDTAARAGATIVVLGSYQVVSTEVRATGKVLDVATGQALGVLKATASQRQLLALEDGLAEQTRETLGLMTAQQLAEAAGEARPPYDDEVAPEVEQATAATEPYTPAVGAYEPYTYEPSYLYTPGYYSYTYPYAYAYPSYRYYGYDYYDPWYYRPYYGSALSLGFFYSSGSKYRHHYPYGAGRHYAYRYDRKDWDRDHDRKDWDKDRDRGRRDDDHRAGRDDHQTRPDDRARTVRPEPRETVTRRETVRPVRPDDNDIRPARPTARDRLEAARSGSTASHLVPDRSRTESPRVQAPAPRTETRREAPTVRTPSPRTEVRPVTPRVQTPAPRTEVRREAPRVQPPAPRTEVRREQPAPPTVRAPEPRRESTARESRPTARDRLESARSGSAASRSGAISRSSGGSSSGGRGGRR